MQRFWDVWRLYDLPQLSFQHIHFHAMVPQLPKLFALFFTVAFGSSMDVVKPLSLSAGAECLQLWFCRCLSQVSRAQHGQHARMVLITSKAVRPWEGPPCLLEQHTCCFMLIALQTCSWLNIPAYMCTGSHPAGSAGRTA